MRKTRPGIDRIETQSLRRLKGVIDMQMSNHSHLCHQCSNSQGDVYARCPEWWRMAKQLHRLRRKLKAQEAPYPYSQQTLSGL